MSSPKNRRTEAQKARKRGNVARHKIYRIEKALKTAGGQAVQLLQARLEYWKGRR